MRSDHTKPEDCGEHAGSSGDKKAHPLPVPAISEDSGIITLHFESEYVQSQMVAQDPDFLALGYTRAMMSFELFKSDPGTILIIGLGGGSLAKWCYRHHPGTMLLVVEINPHVIALRDRFHIPQDDARFKVICEDGAKFVTEQNGNLDVLLVDAFNADSLPEDLSSQDFYDDCHRALSEHGLLIVNLCAAEENLVVSRIRRSFDDKVLCSSSHDGNTVVFACKGDLLWPENTPPGFLKDKLAEFQKKHRMSKAMAPFG